MADLQHHITDALIGHGNLAVWLLSPRSEVVFGNGKVPRVTARVGDVLALEREDNVPMEGLQVPVADAGTLPVASMIVAIDTRPRLKLLATYRWILWGVCVAGVLLSIVLAGRAARTGLASVHRLSVEAAQISPSSLSLRLRSEGIDAELKDLVRAFNVALDRVEAAYAQLQAFTADVAHELRTPLASLINAAQVTLASERSSEVLRETLGDQLEDLEHLKELVNDMLFLARADQGEEAPESDLVSLSDEARKTLEYYEAALDDAGLQVTVEGDATVRGNAGLLRRALSNLLSNAIKNTRPGEIIRVRLRADGGHAVVEVFNPGPAIPDDVRARMFGRFFRADAARSHHGTSHGLGLAIVKAVATMHHGHVFARSEEGNNSVGMRIPV
jgi:two-component system heavy metal sensor histidine kinase CusS